jgi:biotin-(acetyl-CoA carboxylase) ligase
MAAMELKKVTMNLTERDIANTEVLTARLHSRNKASTVSSALAITEGITRKIEDGGELIIRKKDGSMETVVIAGLGAAG